jgi:hypothetical protein
MFGREQLAQCGDATGDPIVFRFHVLLLPFSMVDPL